MKKRNRRSLPVVGKPVLSRAKMNFERLWRRRSVAKCRYWW